MENLQLKINTLQLNPISAAEVKRHDAEEKFISEKEVKEYLSDIALTLYGISDLFEAYHKSLDEEENENYVLGKLMRLGYKGLHDLAYELDTLEKSLKNQGIQIHKVA